MAIPLILLAIGSVFAGYVGVPHALGGSNRIETFLEPSFEAHGRPGAPTTTARVERPEGVVPVAFTQPAQPPAEAETHAAEAAHAETGTELTLMAISSGIALAGIGIAVYFWLRNRPAAAAMAERFRALHRLLLNKYYVDELYDAAIVQPVKVLSTGALWKGMDAGVIDGAVNGVGSAIAGGSGLLRRLQTGSMRTYAFALFAGVVAMVGYYLIR
jgi:NADH-quinone oxidoreductase subunit L